MSKVTAVGFNLNKRYNELFDYAFYDTATRPLISIMGDESELNKNETIDAYDRLLGNIVAGGGWGKLYHNFYQREEKELFIQANIDQLELLTIYKATSLADHFSFKVLIVKVSPFEAIVYYKDYKTKDIGIGVIDSNNKTLKVSFNLNNLQTILSPLHIQLLDSYITGMLTI